MGYYGIKEGDYDTIRKKTLGCARKIRIVLGPEAPSREPLVQKPYDYEKGFRRIPRGARPTAGPEAR